MRQNPLRVEFLVRGATEYGEPGVFMAFEDTAEELAANVASLGFDLKRLVAQRKMAIDYVRVERSEIEETGEYDLEGLFVRLQYARCWAARGTTRKHDPRLRNGWYREDHLRCDPPGGSLMPSSVPTARLSSSRQQGRPRCR
jgi:KaiC